MNLQRAYMPRGWLARIVAMLIATVGGTGGVLLPASTVTAHADNQTLGHKLADLSRQSTDALQQMVAINGGYSYCYPIIVDVPLPVVTYHCTATLSLASMPATKQYQFTDGCSLSEYPCNVDVNVTLRSTWHVEGGGPLAQFATVVTDSTSRVNGFCEWGGSPAACAHIATLDSNVAIEEAWSINCLASSASVDPGGGSLGVGGDQKSVHWHGSLDYPAGTAPDLTHNASGIAFYTTGFFGIRHQVLGTVLMARMPETESADATAGWK